MIGGLAASTPIALRWAADNKGCLDSINIVLLSSQQPFTPPDTAITKSPGSASYQAQFVATSNQGPRNKTRGDHF
jgi:hypothetical protein